MAISQTDIQHLLSLARLKVTDDEARTLATDIASILEHVDALKSVDVSQVEATQHGPRAAPLREDVVVEGVGVRGLDGSAGQTEPGIRVPRILG